MDIMYILCVYHWKILYLILLHRNNLELVTHSCPPYKLMLIIWWKMYFPPTKNSSYAVFSAVKRSIGSITGCTIMEKAPTRTFSWLKAPTSAFTFKTLLRHYAKRALTPRSLNVKLGPQHKSQKGRAGWLLA